MRTEASTSVSPPSGRSAELTSQLVREIENGVWTEGQRLPTTRQLAHRFRMSPNTVHGAMRILEQKGFVENRQRSGRYVKRDAPSHSRARNQIAIVRRCDPVNLLKNDMASEEKMLTSVPRSWTAEIVEAVDQGFVETEYNLVSLRYTSQGAGPVAEILPKIEAMSDMLAGVICVSRPGVEALCSELDERGLPWVAITPADRQSKFNFVAADNFGAGVRLGRCLARMGLTELVILSAQYDRRVSFLDHVTGIYRGYIEEHQSTQGIRLIEVSDVLISAGQEAIEACLLEQSSPPQAIVGIGDRLAMGAMRTCHNRGLRVPEDVQVAGTTGLPLGEVVHPALTTLAQPMSQIGHEAGRMVRWMVKTGARRVTGRYIPGPFIYRESLRVPASLRKELDAEYEKQVATLSQLPDDSHSMTPLKA